MERSFLQYVHSCPFVENIENLLALVVFFIEFHTFYTRMKTESEVFGWIFHLSQANFNGKLIDFFSFICENVWQEFTSVTTKKKERK